MGKHASVFVVLFAGWGIACASDPPPAASSAPPPSAPATAAAAPSDPPAPAKADIMSCLGNIDPRASEACKSCMASSCAGPLQTVGTSCPDFTRCICGGGNMMQCMSSLMAPGCAQAGQAVGTCKQTSCASQCPAASPTPTPSPNPAPSPTPTPTPAAGDSCATLAACCPQLPAPAQTGCTTVVGMKNPNAPDMSVAKD